MQWSLVLCTALLWLQASAEMGSHCPSSIAQDRYNQVLQERCYRFVFHTKLEYWNAERYCRSKGGQLAMPKTSAINDFLTDHLKYTYRYRHDVWIGLNDYDTENQFEWVDGSKLGAYSNWLDENEGPRGGINHPFRHRYEDCVVLDAGTGGKWLDYRCEDLYLIADEHKYFVCEFPLIPPTKTTQYPDTTTPIYDTTPYETTTPPYDTTTPPHDTTTPPYDTTTPTTPPYDTTTPPYDTTTPTTPPYDTTTPPYDTTPPHDTSTPPYDTTTPPYETTPY